MFFILPFFFLLLIQTIISGIIFLFFFNLLITPGITFDSFVNPGVTICFAGFTYLVCSDNRRER